MAPRRRWFARASAEVGPPLRSGVQTLAQIKELLASRGLSPRKKLGQNFLIDKNLIGKLVDAGLAGVAAVHPVVLEVGPGTGALTEALLERGCRVVAVELDAGLAAMLRERTPELLSRFPGSSLTVVEGDCLSGPGGRAVNPEAIAALSAQGGEFSLIANLPYGAGTPLMLALLCHHTQAGSVGASGAGGEHGARCTRMAVTIQREVADRLAASPGSGDYGTLGVVAQAMGEVSRLADLPPECFWPRPEVHSAMVIVEPRERALTTDPLGLAAFSQRLFSKRRKQLGAILGRSLAWPAGIAATDRPEVVSVEGMVALMAAAAAAAEEGESGGETGGKSGGLREDGEA